MSSFYDFWFKKGTWNSKQAAILFNGRDPRMEKNQIEFPTEIDDFSGIKQDTWQWEVVENYFIFETSNRKQNVNEMPYPNFRVRSPIEDSPEAFIDMATSKGIIIPAKFRDAYGAHLMRTPFLTRHSFTVAMIGSTATDDANTQDAIDESNERQSKVKDVNHPRYQ